MTPVDEFTTQVRNYYFNADLTEVKIVFNSLNGKQITELTISKLGLMIEFEDGEGSDFMFVPFSELRGMINTAKGL